MRLSERARSVEPFHAVAFAERAEELARAGHHVVRLGIGEPDFGAPPAVREAMREVMDGRPLPYAPVPGIPELRAAIADFYRARYGVRVDPDRILLASGASTALVLALAAVIDPGDEVILADPSYPCYRQVIPGLGGRPVCVPTSAATRFQLDADSVSAAWTERTSAVLIATPSNPTGATIARDELRAICGLTAAHGAWRIVDEIYLDLADHDAAGRPRSTVLADDPDAIVINSFSKYFGMTGWRLGWCVLPEVLVEPVHRLAMNWFLSASLPVQMAALACFTPDSLALSEKRRLEYVARRRLVLEGLGAIGLPVPVVPDGAFYVYFDVSPTGLDAWQFCERALDEAHVALTPGRDFGPTTADTHVRLSYATSGEELTEGLARLRRFVSSLRVPSGGAR